MAGTVTQCSCLVPVSDTTCNDRHPNAVNQLLFCLLCLMDSPFGVLLLMMTGMSLSWQRQQHSSSTATCLQGWSVWPVYGRH